MRKLFYLLLAMPLVFAACEDPEQGVDQPADKEYAAELTLTSEATLEFEAEGGEGVITYTAQMVEVTRESPAPQPEVEATCEADWVTDLAVAEDITFTVVANEAEARETKVVVTYSDKSFEVAVKQAAKQNDEPEPEPEPEDGIKFVATYLQGDYYGDEYSPGVGNYFVYLSDLGIDEEGYASAGGTYYRLDLYGPMFEGEGEVALPVGTYNFDANDTMAEWTIGNYYSAYIVFDEYGNSTTGESGAHFTAATLVVTETGLTLTATIDGQEHTVTYEGKGDFVDYTAEVAPSEFEANYTYAVYYGDQYSPGAADNFYFFFSDLGVDENGWELPNGTYYRFDLYTEIIDTTNGIYIPEGTYTYDCLDSMQVGTFSDINSAYYVMDADGWDYVVNSSLGEGSITFTESGVTAEVLINGATHIITYEGNITFIDVSSSGGGGEGETLSTLTEDKVLDIEGATVILEYYGDYYYNGTDNWVVYIYEDMETLNGAYLMFEILCDPAADNIAGTYAADSWGECDTAYTYLPGYVSGDDMWGSWYVDMLGGDINEDLAPIFDGEFTIDIDADGVYTFTFDCLDDVGYTITGSIKATMSSEATTLSAKPAKRAKANNFAKRVNSEKLSSKAVTKGSTLSVR